MNAETNQWRFLDRKPKSAYRHLFIKGRNVSAWTIYNEYRDAGMTPEQIAADRDLPLEAVREAIAYMESNPPELAADRAMEEASLINRRPLRDHRAFLNGDAPQDEGLYDDCPAG